MSIGKLIRSKIRAGRGGEIYKAENEAEKFKKNVVKIIELDKQKQIQQQIQQRETREQNPMITGLKRYAKKAVKNCLR